MRIKEVLLRAMNKEYSWLRAADILGITAPPLGGLKPSPSGDSLGMKP